MVFSNFEVEQNPVVSSVNYFAASLSPSKFARWIAACPDQQPAYSPKERIVQYVQNIAQAFSGNHKCEAQPSQSFLGRLGTIAKRCGIVFGGVLAFTGVIYGISVGLEKTGEWLKIPYKCMIPQSGTCFGDPIQVTENGVTKEVRHEIPCPLVEGPCGQDNWLQNGLNDWSSKIGEWLVTGGKEGQDFSLKSAINMLLPIYGAVVAAPSWAASKVDTWKIEQLKTDGLVSDSIKFGTTLFSRVEASWKSISEELAKHFS